MTTPPARKHRLLFYVQHLLGIGHLVRSLRLARGLAQHGFEVLVVSGGEAIPGFDWGVAKYHQLPPVKITPPDFSTLLNPDGSIFTDAQKNRRAQELCQLFDDFMPDVFILEAFPFGRRQMRFELIPLLERAHARHQPPIIATSVRDILQAQKKPERVQEMLDTINQYCDFVLVHGDEKLIALEASFPRAKDIAQKLVYTGLVGPELVPPRALAKTDEEFDVIVSAGGGAVGARLLTTALEVHAVLGEQGAPFTALRWLFLTGPNMPENVTQHLAKMTPTHNSARITLAKFRPDLPALLHHAKLSISQAGYNTVVDLLEAKCRAVLVPFAEHGESEQSLRAQKMAAAKLAVLLEEATLNTQRLANAVKQALDLPTPDFLVKLNGIKTSAQLIQARLAARID